MVIGYAYVGATGSADKDSLSEVDKCLDTCANKKDFLPTETVFRLAT